MLATSKNARRRSFRRACRAAGSGWRKAVRLVWKSRRRSRAGGPRILGTERGILDAPEGHDSRNALGSGRYSLCVSTRVRSSAEAPGGCPRADGRSGTPRLRTPRSRYLAASARAPRARARTGTAMSPTSAATEPAGAARRPRAADSTAAPVDPAAPGGSAVPSVASGRTRRPLGGHVETLDRPAAARRRPSHVPALRRRVPVELSLPAGHSPR
jgi:hypothetical protein